MVGDPSAETQQSLDGERDLPELPAPLGRTLLFLTFAVLTSIALCWCLRRQATAPGTGKVKGLATAVASDWTGRINRFLVNPGDSVQVGDPLAIMVNEKLILQIERQRKDLEELELALQRANQSADEELSRCLAELDEKIVAIRARQSRLANEGRPPYDNAVELQLRDLESERLESAHQIRESLGLSRIRREWIAADASLRALEAQPILFTLPASVSGTVGRMLRQVGDRVVAGTPLLELADRDQPYLIVEMPEPVAKRFALGDTIPLKFPGSAKSLGRVANMELIETDDARQTTPSDKPQREANVRFEIVPDEDDWPVIPLKSSVQVRTSDSNAMSRRVH